jgi:hypothetical protein
MHSRFVNTALLVVTLVLGVSGVVMLYGTWYPWVFDLHRIAGWSLIALIPWKGAIIWRSLKRGVGSEFDRSVLLGVSVVLAVLVLVIVVLATRSLPDGFLTDAAGLALDIGFGHHPSVSHPRLAALAYAVCQGLCVASRGAQDRGGHRCGRLGLGDC